MLRGLEVQALYRKRRGSKDVTRATRPIEVHIVPALVIGNSYAARFVPALP